MRFTSDFCIAINAVFEARPREQNPFPIRYLGKSAVPAHDLAYLHRLTLQIDAVRLR